jgi:ribonuclease-3
VDAKSALQELLARRRARVTYAVIGESGPAHQRTFEVEATVEGERVGTGSGRSKKAAEQVAAEEALKHLGH